MADRRRRRVAEDEGEETETETEAGTSEKELKGRPSECVSMVAFTYCKSSSSRSYILQIGH